MKLEEAKCGLLVPHNWKLLEWTKTVRINGQEIKALLDTGYYDPCTSPVHHQRRLLGMGHFLPDHFIQMDLLPCCKCRAGDRGESHKNSCGSVGAHWSGYVDEKRYTPLLKLFEKGARGRDSRRRGAYATCFR